MVAALAVPSLSSGDTILIWATLGLCVACFFCAVICLLAKGPRGVEQSVGLATLEKVATGLGAPTTIFTIVILCCVWLFHRTSPVEVFAILTAWTLIVALAPVEATLAFWRWLFDRSKRKPKQVIGVVAAYQSPGLVLVRQHDEARHNTGQLMALSDAQGPTTLGVALNYVGRDEGILLRALSLPVPPALRDHVRAAAVGSGVATPLAIDEVGTREVMVLNRITSLCGIVDSNSSLEFIEIEIVVERGVAEGRLVDVKVDDQYVIYQIIDGVTHEEAVQQKNKYGYVRAKARKIGEWNPDSRKFSPAPWLPRINSPVFLKSTNEFQHNRNAVGHFPGTDYEISINISDAVTHNTAILGILGIGKSYLALELAERMLADRIKLICLDLTDQYESLLAEFVDVQFQARARQLLSDAAKGRPVTAGKEEGGAAPEFNRAAITLIEEFMSPNCTAKILILNPAAFRVSKQTTNAYQHSAAFSDLTACEITAIVSNAALTACQNLGMTDRARACLVYEEAHSLVPEWNSVAAEGDKNATAASARAILQGRKYGLGCLLITQRTANVTKTILNQCNSVFAMRTFDDTGKDFLANYIGSEYARVLPTLKERHAVFFGKASSCDDPVLIRLNDRDKFISAFRDVSEKIAGSDDSVGDEP